jgi:RecB family exonuclease
MENEMDFLIPNLTTFVRCWDNGNVFLSEDFQEQMREYVE